MGCASPLDFDQLKKEFEIHANESGMDLNEILESAGKHFAGCKITPYSKPLTDTEIDALIKNDEKFLSE